MVRKVTTWSQSVSKAGTISVFVSKRDLREAVDWLGRRKPKEASWLVSQEDIDEREALLANLAMRFEKAFRRKGRKFKRVELPKDEAEAFHLVAMPFWPTWGAGQPRGVRKLYKRMRLALKAKPGPRRRNQPRQKVEIDPDNLTGMQKVYRRRAKLEAKFAEMTADGQTFLGSATQYPNFKKGKKLP